MRRKMKTAVEWLDEQLQIMESKSFNNIIQIELGRDNYKEIIEQAKEMEKEQEIGFAEFVASYPDKNRNVNGEMLHAKSKYDGAERTVDLLEIYTQKEL
jgi:hypothetical protein